MVFSIAFICLLYSIIDVIKCNSECYEGCTTNFDMCVNSIDDQQGMNSQEAQFTVCIQGKHKCLEECKKTKSAKRDLRSLEKSENEKNRKELDLNLCFKSCEVLLQPCLNEKQSALCIKTKYLTCVSNCEEKDAYSRKIKRLERKLNRVSKKINRELSHF